MTPTVNITLSDNTLNFTLIDLDKKKNYDIFKSIYIVLDVIIFIMNTLYLISEIFEIKKLKKKKNLLSYVFNKWNPKRIPSGVYFIQLDINNYIQTQKVLFVKFAPYFTLHLFFQNLRFCSNVPSIYRYGLDRAGSAENKS